MLPHVPRHSCRLTLGTRGIDIALSRKRLLQHGFLEAVVCEDSDTTQHSTSSVLRRTMGDADQGLDLIASGRVARLAQFQEEGESGVDEITVRARIDHRQIAGDIKGEDIPKTKRDRHAQKERKGESKRDGYSCRVGCMPAAFILFQYSRALSAQE